VKWFFFFDFLVQFRYNRGIILEFGMSYRPDLSAFSIGRLFASFKVLSLHLKCLQGQNRGMLRLKIYEISNLHQSLVWSIPPRGFLVIEQNRKIQNKRITWTEERFLCATTMPKWKANANVVRQIVHAKWGIENNGFNDLKNNW
jgi:hypothetical protein